MFDSSLRIEPYGDYDFRLTRDLNYYSNKYKIFINIPEGFVTDLASTPVAVRAIFPKHGPWTPAAVVHDYLYTTQQFSRLKSDRIFLEACKVLNVPAWKRYSMFIGLRIGGWISWKLNKG